MKSLALLPLILLLLISQIGHISTPVLQNVPPEGPVVLIQHIPVGAFFYVWYGFNETSQTWTGGNGTSHWNDQPATSFLDVPFAYYSSNNETTIKWQLDQMHEADLDFAVVSWWGPNDYTDTSLKTLFQYVHAQNDPKGIKLSIIVEPYNDLNITEAKNYVLENYYEPFADHVFNWGGKPLLCWFMPTRPLTDDRFTMRVVGNGDPDWIYVAGLRNYLESTNKPPAEQLVYINGFTTAFDGEVTVTPRFDNLYEFQIGGRRDYIQFDTQYTGMYNELWTYAAANAKIILINSWNEYTEGSMLEPHFDEHGQWIDRTHITVGRDAAAAVKYLQSHFNSDLNLIYESEDSGVHWLKANEFPDYKWNYQQTYWAYSDNLFTYLALEPFDPAMSHKIVDSIVTIPNVGEFLTLNGTPTLEYRRVVDIVVASSPNYMVLSRTYTGQRILPPLGFADERMYYALSLFELGNAQDARQQFQIALNMWNGTCFVDDNITLKRNTNDGALTDHGFCANNRIGLALFVGKVLNMPVPSSLQTVLWSMQNADGGIASLSLNGAPLGSANAETTALALLQFNYALIFRIQGG